MRVLLLLFSLGLLIAFAGIVLGISLAFAEPKQKSIGPEDWIQLQEIQKRFEKEFQIKTDTVILLVDDVKYHKKKSTTIGYCTVDWIGSTAEYRHKYIQIKKQWWINSSDLAREFLLFHELAHCDMFLGHITKFDHVMNPIIGATLIGKYIEDKQAYLDDLAAIYKIAKKELVDIRLRQTFNF